jgi:hypothetical protein
LPERTYLVMDWGGRPFALPSESVEMLKSWEDPHPLPLASPWVMGLLCGEGGAIPVLKDPWLREGPGTPQEVLALVRARGALVAIAGNRPRLCAPDATEPAVEEGAGPWTTVLRFGAESVACLDPEKLYLELGLH